MSNFVEYIIGLKDQFSAAAERISAESSKAKSAINAMGQSANAAEAKIGKLGASMSAMSKGQQAVVQGNAKAGESFTKMAAQATKAEADIMAFREKAAARMANKFSENPRYKPGGDRYIGTPPAASAAAERSMRGLSHGMGLYALGSVGENHTLERNIEFEEQVRLTRGILVNASAEQIAKLRSEAINLAKGSLFTATDVMESFKDLASQGVDLKDMPLAVKQVMDLATGSGEKVKETMDTHLAILRQFNLPFKDIPHVSDMLAMTQMKTGATLSNIKESFKMAGPISSTFGVEPETLAAMVGGLALKGIRGSLAGTGIRRGMTGMFNWNSKNEKVWKSLGIKKSDLVDMKTGHLKDMFDNLELLRERTEQNVLPKGETRGGVLMKLFGDRGGPAMAALMDSVEGMRKLREELNHTEGQAEKMAHQGMKGLAAATKQTEAAWNALSIAIGDSGFNEDVESMTRTLTGFLGKLTNGSPAVLKGLGWVALAGETLNKLMMPLIALSLVGPGVMAMFTGLGARLVGLAGMSRIAASAGLLASSLRLLMGITGIGAALFIGYEVIQNWDRIASAIGRVKDALSGMLKGDFSGLKTLGSDIAKAIAGKEDGKPQDWGLIGKAGEALKSMPPRSPVQPNFNPRGAPSAGAAAGAAKNAAQDRIKIESNVRTTLDPIIVKGEPITVNIKGTINGQVTGTGSTPLSATAPRGQSTAQDAAPRVSR